MCLKFTITCVVQNINKYVQWTYVGNDQGTVYGSGALEMFTAQRLGKQEVAI